MCFLEWDSCDFWLLLHYLQFKDTWMHSRPEWLNLLGRESESNTVRSVHVPAEITKSCPGCGDLLSSQENLPCWAWATTAWGPIKEKSHVWLLLLISVSNGAAFNGCSRAVPQSSMAAQRGSEEHSLTAWNRNTLKVLRGRAWQTHAYIAKYILSRKRVTKSHNTTCRSFRKKCED